MDPESPGTAARLRAGVEVRYTHEVAGGGQVVPSDVLIDAIWPGAAPGRPEDQLAVLMSRLRSVLGRDRIGHRDTGYLLRAWTSRRAAAGETALFAACGPLDRALPLDALLSALGQLLRRLGPEASADLLDADAALVTPALGTASGAREVPMLADSTVGPAMFYSALLRVLGRLATRQPVVLVIDDAHLAGPALGNWLRFARSSALACTCGWPGRVLDQCALDRLAWAAADRVAAQFVKVGGVGEPP